MRGVHSLAHPGARRAQATTSTPANPPCRPLPLTPPPAKRPAQVQGTFAFVIWDAAQHRVFAARDAAGAQPLFWGATAEGQLLLGSDLADLEECDPTATMFPAGTLFASERHIVAYSPGDRCAGWGVGGGGAGVFGEEGEAQGQAWGVGRGVCGERGVVWARAASVPGRAAPRRRSEASQRRCAPRAQRTDGRLH